MRCRWPQNSPLRSQRRAMLKSRKVEARKSAEPVNNAAVKAPLHPHPHTPTPPRTHAPTHPHTPTPTHTHTPTHPRTPTPPHPHTPTHTHTPTHPHTHTPTHPHTHTPTHPHTHTPTHPHTHPHPHPHPHTPPPHSSLISFGYLALLDGKDSEVGTSQMGQPQGLRYLTPTIPRDNRSRAFKRAVRRTPEIENVYVTQQYEQLNLKTVLIESQP